MPVFPLGIYRVSVHLVYFHPLEVLKVQYVVLNTIIASLLGFHTISTLAHRFVVTPAKVAQEQVAKSFGLKRHVRYSAWPKRHFAYIHFCLNFNMDYKIKINRTTSREPQAGCFMKGEAAYWTFLKYTP